MRVIADDDVRADKLATIPVELSEEIPITVFTASVAMSDVLLSPIELDAEDSDKIAERVLEESSAAQALGKKNASGSLVFVREFDPATLQPDVALKDAKFQALKNTGTMAAIAVRRGGKKATAAWAIGDEIDIFVIETDTPRHEAVTGYHKDRVPLVVKRFVKHAIVIAGV